MKINVPSDIEICIVGDIHEHEEQFFKLVDAWKPSNKRWLVSVGDVHDKGFGKSATNRITNYFIDLHNEGIGYVVRGNHELKLIKKTNNLSTQLNWWKEQPLVLTFEFQRGKKVTVLHAGVTPRTTSETLGKRVEVCYIREVDSSNGKSISLVWEEVDGKKVLVKKKEGTNWHKLYDGRFGYIVAGHDAQKDGKPKFFNNSCNIDTGVYETGILTGQIILSNGNLGKTISIEGKPSNWKA